MNCLDEAIKYLAIKLLKAKSDASTAYNSEKKNI